MDLQTLSTGNLCLVNLQLNSYKVRTDSWKWQAWKMNRLQGWTKDKEYKQEQIFP